MNEFVLRLCLLSSLACLVSLDVQNGVWNWNNFYPFVGKIVFDKITYFPQ